MAYLIPSERAVHDNIHSTAFIASPACLHLIIIPLIPHKSCEGRSRVRNLHNSSPLKQLVNNPLVSVSDAPRFEPGTTVPRHFPILLVIPRLSYGQPRDRGILGEL